jgi:hypothetical protein
LTRSDASLNRSAISLIFETKPGSEVALIAVPHALPHLETGTPLRLIPQWYSDAGPISIYYATRTLLPAKTRVFVFVVEAFRATD